MENRDNVVRDGNFEVGDIAVYGPPYEVEAVVPCVRAGDSRSARFNDEGRWVKMTHRPGLLVVVRPGGWN